MNNTLNKVRDALEDSFRTLNNYEWLSKKEFGYVVFSVDEPLAKISEALRHIDRDVATYEMDRVAITHAHGLALDLECILADDYHGKWYNSALNRLASYREAMNAIHERESPTFLGEPVIRERGINETTS